MNKLFECIYKLLKDKQEETETYSVVLSCLVVNGKVVERNIRELEWNKVPINLRKEIARTTALNMMRI